MLDVALAPVLPDTGTIVDIGSGWGFVLRWLHGKGMRAVGVEAVKEVAELTGAWHGDYKDFVVPSDCSLMYLFNPFNFTEAKTFFEWAQEKTPMIFYVGESGAASIFNPHWDVTALLFPLFQPTNGVIRGWSKSIYIARE